MAKQALRNSDTSREIFYEPEFFHLPIRSAQQQPSTEMYASMHLPLCQNHISTSASSEQFPKTTWEAIFRIISSVQSLSCVQLFATHELQHARPPCPSPTPRVHPNSCPSSRWCHPAISSSVIPFSSCPQYFPASESFPMTQLFPWSGQSIRVPALASVLPKNTQDSSPLEWTGWISLQCKEFSRVFSSTTVQKHQYFGIQPSSQSNSHIHTWPQEKQ